MTFKAPIFDVVVPATVMWEHIFAIDVKRVQNGKTVGDDRHNMTVLFRETDAAEALQAAAKAVAHRTTDQQAITAAVFKRLKPIEDEGLKKLGFAYKMKAYSRDPVPVISKQGGHEIKPSERQLSGPTYPQFKLGVKQGAAVHVHVGFRVYEEADGHPGCSAFLNAVLLDEATPPVQLPGGRPDPTRLFGSLIEGAAPAAAGAFAGLMDGETQKAGDDAAAAAAKALGFKL